MPSAERQTPKIRRTLTLAYATSLLLVLLLSGGVLRWAMRAALDREFERSIVASTELLQQFFLVEINEYLTTEATLTHILGELVFEDRNMHMRRPDRTEFELLGMRKPYVHRDVAPPVRHVLRPLSESLAPGWIIDVEASTAHVEAVKQRLDKWFALGIPLLVLLAAVSGWWLTGRTLRPVGQMASAAAAILPGSGGRLPVDNPADELGQLGTRFNALLDRLDLALSQQRRFLADAAHELRTPLARARGRMEIAMMTRDATADDPDALTEDGLRTDSHHAVRAAHDELVRMSQLVDELLQLARADDDSDGPALHAMPVFLDDIVADELGRWNAEAQRHDITMACTTLQETPIVGDATLLARATSILVDNALRYGHAGGHIDVRVSNDGIHAILEVEDDGIGIPPEESTRLFERFFRGARARARQSDGSGLGLAIAQWICVQHHGSITLRSSGSQRGTCATVRLPLDPTRLADPNVA